MGIQKSPACSTRLGLSGRAARRMRGRREGSCTAVATRSAARHQAVWQDSEQEGNTRPCVHTELRLATDPPLFAVMKDDAKLFEGQLKAPYNYGIRVFNRRRIKLRFFLSRCQRLVCRD